MALKLRPSIIKEIQKTLNNTRTHINALDFIIEQGEGSLTIIYNYNTDYYIRFDFTNKEEEYTEQEETSNNLSFSSTRKTVKRKEHLLKGQRSPGKLVVKEDFEFYGTYSIYTNIKQWVENLWEDLSSNPVVRELNDQKKELDDFLKQFSINNIPNGDKYFSKQETEELKERLKKVEDQLAEELKQAVSDKTKLKSELNELKKELETLKQTIPNLTKKGWVKYAISKLYIWGSKKNNQNLIKATANYGKALLEGAKDKISGQT